MRLLQDRRYRKPKSLLEVGVPAHAGLVGLDEGVLLPGGDEPLLAGLREKKINFTVYSNVQPNPTIDNVEEAGFFGRLYDSIVLWFKNLFAE